MPKTTKRVSITDLNKELVLGLLGNAAFQRWMGQYIKALPQYVDDLQRDFGLDLYERMSNDPALSSALTVIKSRILGDGARVMGRVNAPTGPEIDPEEQKRFERSEEIRQVAEKMLNRLQMPLSLVLMDMLSFMEYGHSVAELVYEYRDGLLQLENIGVKPRRSYGFVVNEYMRLKGFVAVTEPGQAAINRIASLTNPEDIIDREKFLVLSYFPVAGDPRGKSILRPAYNAWYLKQQIWPQYLKYLSMFGTPSIAGFLGPDDATDVEEADDNGDVVIDSDGEPVTMTAEEALVAKLVSFANGTALAMSHGASIEVIQAVGNGEAFVTAFDLLDREMVRTVLLSARTVLEAQHGSKADSNTAQDVLAPFCELLQSQVEVCFYRDVLLPWAVYNWGEEVADEYCPYLSLSDVAKEDVIEKGNMIANLARAQFLHTSQYPGIDADLGLPERDYEAMIEEMEAEKEQAKLFDLNLKSATEPDPEDDPKPPKQSGK